MKRKDFIFPLSVELTIHKLKCQCGKYSGWLLDYRLTTLWRRLWMHMTKKIHPTRYEMNTYGRKTKARWSNVPDIGILFPLMISKVKRFKCEKWPAVAVLYIMTLLILSICHYDSVLKWNLVIMNFLHNVSFKKLYTRKLILLG